MGELVWSGGQRGLSEEVTVKQEKSTSGSMNCKCTICSTPVVGGQCGTSEEMK